MKELHCSAINNLGPQQSKVTQVCQMKQQIVPKFLSNYLSSTFTHEGLTSRWQSTVADVTVRKTRKPTILGTS